MWWEGGVFARRFSGCYIPDTNDTIIELRHNWASREDRALLKRDVSVYWLFCRLYKVYSI